MKIYQNKGHGGVGLRLVFKIAIGYCRLKISLKTQPRETFGPETAEIENIVWQTINGVFEEVLNPEYFKQTIEKNPWTWTLRKAFKFGIVTLEIVEKVLF